MTIQANLPTSYAILETARQQVLDDGIGLAHEVRLKHCGEDVEVEGIISIKTGDCPEDRPFCSQSGLFDSPVWKTKGSWTERTPSARSRPSALATTSPPSAAPRPPT